MKTTLYDLYLNFANKNKLIGLFDYINKYDNERTVIDITYFESLLSDKEIKEYTNSNDKYISAHKTLIYFTYFMWKDKNFFEISSELIDNLNFTDINNIDSYFIIAPYRSMCIHLQKAIIFDDKEYNELILTFNKYSETKYYNPPFNDRGFTKYLYILVGSTNLFRTIANFEFPFGEGKLIDDINYFLKKDKDNYWYIDFYKQIINVITKILLYMNTINCNIVNYQLNDIKENINNCKISKKEKKRLKQKLNYKINNYKLMDIPITLKDKYNSIKYEKTGLFKNPIKVRGHFRNQAYGKNYMERKIKWIEPYIKGDIKKDFNKQRNYKVY